MADVTCTDGSVLTVVPVPCLDRSKVPYEVTLRMLRHGVPFGEVGQRCGFLLASTALRLRAARETDQEFPAGALEAGLRAWAADADTDADQAWRAFQHYVPRERELFSFLSRDPDDVCASGELRVWVRDVRTWLQPGADGGRGRWRLRRHAVLDAWGSDGVGVRAVLCSDELLALLEQLLTECAAVGAAPEREIDLRGVRRPVG
ncbi:MAG: hypothetical protein WD794_13345 [Mycobacteriales bacterium]